MTIWTIFELFVLIYIANLCINFFIYNHMHVVYYLHASHGQKNALVKPRSSGVVDIRSKNSVGVTFPRFISAQRPLKSRQHIKLTKTGKNVTFQNATSVFRKDNIFLYDDINYMNKESKIVPAVVKDENNTKEIKSSTPFAVSTKLNLPLLEIKHLMNIEKIVINEKICNSTNMHRENNIGETPDMKVIKDVFRANQMLPSECNEGYPVSEAYDKDNSVKKTGLETFEGTKALELDGVKHKTFSLELNVDNSITEVRHKRNQIKSWFQARNHMKLLYKKGNNSC